MIVKRIPFVPLALTLLLAGGLCAGGVPVSQAQGTYTGYTRYIPYRQANTPYTYTQVYAPPPARQVALPVELASVRSAAQPQSAVAIVQTMLSANGLPMQLVNSVRVTNQSGLNAGTDGKNIIVTGGLWNQLATNDERAFVLGHELSHIVLNHIGKTQVRQVGLGLIDQLLLSRYVQSSPLLDTLGNLGLGLIDKRSSRTMEYQADDLGIQLMTKAGYEPNAALRVFGVLQAASRNGSPEFLQDHPLSESRIRALVQKYNLAVR